MTENPSKPCYFSRNFVKFAVALESVRQIGVTQRRYAGSQRRAESREVKTTFSVISGQWVGRESRHRRRLSTLCLRRVESCKFIIVVSNMVNGRCPGCDYIKIPWRPCKHRLYPVGRNKMCYIGLFTALIIISAWALTLSVRQQ